MSLSRQDIQSIVYKGTFIFVLALILWYASRCSEATKVEKNSSENVLRVGVDLLPNGFGIDESGRVEGLQKKLVTTLLPEDSIIWVPFTDRNKALEALREGEISLYATSYPYAQSDDLEEILPTEWIYYENFSLLLSYEKLEHWEHMFQDVGGTVEVYVSDNEPAAKVTLNNLSELSYPAIKVVESDLNPVQLCVKLINGEIDYLLASSAIIQSVVEADSTLRVVDHIAFKTRQVWLLGSKEFELKERLNREILSQRDDINKWLIESGKNRDKTR